MPVVCPDVTVYQDLASGQVALDEQETLLEHLEQCEACGQRLSAVPIQDALAELVRKAREPGEATPADDLVRVIQRLSKFALPRVAILAEGKTMGFPDHAEKQAAARADQSTPNIAEARTEEGSHLATPSGDTLGSGEQLSSEQLCSFLAKPETAEELGRLGGYRVLKLLGAGGMGVVFLAEDPRLKRRVALKAMLPSLAATATAKQRFTREAQAAAAIKHDHIVTIYQVDEDRGAPFLAMELLEGEPLDSRLKREGKLPLAEVLRIGGEIAEGLAAAHSGGLIHRDIKPANIWLEGKRGRVKVLDFGLARAADDLAPLTQSGAIMGTPGYMAPEQASGESVDARCDLFSLGCVLYQLVAGVQPFLRGNSMQTLFAITFEEPRGLREYQAQVPDALVDLIRRLLAKKREQRPASASAVAEELRALTSFARPGSAKEPEDATAVLAPVKTPVARARRGRRRLMLGAIPAVLFVAAALVAAVLILRVETPNGTLIVQIPEAEAENVQLSVKQGGREVELVDLKTRKELKLPVGAYQLDLVGGKEGLRLESKEYDLKSGDRRVAKVIFEPRTTPAGPIPGSVVATSAGSSPLDQLDPARIPEAERVPGMPSEVVAVLGESRRRHRTRIGAVALHPDGRLEASCDDEGVHVWDVATGEQVFRNRVGGHPRGCAFSPNGEVLAAGSDNGIQRWRVRNWNSRLPEWKGKVGSEVKFSPDGSLLASAGGAARSLTLWNADSGEQVIHLENYVEGTSYLDFSPDGKLLACGPGRAKGGIELYDLTAKQPLATLEEDRATRNGAGYELESVSFSSDGSLLAAGNALAAAGAYVRIWEVQSRKELPRVSAQSTHVRAVFAPRSKLLALAVDDGTIRLWDLAASKELRRLEGHTYQPSDLAFSRDGATLASAGGLDQTVRIWDVATGKEKNPLRPGSTGQVVDQRFTLDGKKLLTLGTDDMVRIWELPTLRMSDEFFGGSERGSLLPHAVWGAKQANSVSALDSAAQTVAVARGQVWDLATKKPRRSIKGYWSVALTPDGKVLAGVRRGSSVIEFTNLETGNMLPSLQCEKEIWGVLTFSPDGKLLAYWTDGKIVLQDWRLQTKPTLLPYGPSPSFHPLCFSPDGRSFVDLWLRTGDRQGAALCETGTGQVVVPLDLSYATQPVISPDGSLLAVLTFGGTGLQVFQLPSGKSLREWRGMPDCSCIAFAPDSRHLTLGARNGVTRILRLGSEFHAPVQ